VDYAGTYGNEAVVPQSAAVRAALREVEGAYAVVVSHAEHDLIVAARATSPMVLGLGAGENFVASDIPALLPYTREVVFLHDGDMAVIDKGQVTITDFAGNASYLGCEGA
jgi:glutamine---fructose-6-phosphate transaminase (isomerizing)